MKNKIEGTIVYENKGFIGYIALNRPASRNAMNREMRMELEEYLVSARDDDQVRVVIITGTGNAFSAGADLSELANNLRNPMSAREGAIRGQILCNMVEGLGKPVIAAVNGYAVGGGCELVLACTIRVASLNSRFSLPEIKVGTLPGHGGIPRLVRLVGKDRAAELILSGDMIDAQEAYRIGLVTHIVSPDDLLSACENIAQRIIDKSEGAVRLALEAINRVEEMSMQSALNLEAAFASLASSSQESKEKIAQFMVNKKND